MSITDAIERYEPAGEINASRYRFVYNVPRARLVEVIEGKDKIERSIETSFSVQLSMDIDSSTGRVEFFFESEEAMRKLTVKIRQVLEAFSFGFMLNQALSLCQDGVHLRIYDLHDLAPRKYARHLRKVKARVIGRKGSCLRRIEELSETQLSLEGQRIAIIGKAEGIKAVYAAVKMLAEGKAHRRAYGYLERYRSEAKRKRQLQSYRPAVHEDG